MTTGQSTETRVEPFTRDLVPAVRAFNERLAAGGAGWRFPDDPIPDWLPPGPNAEVFQEYFLFLEGREVRGAYVLKHQEVSFRGKVRRVGNLYLPISEGTINRAYGLVAGRLLRDAVERERLLFMVAQGGPDAQVTRLARALGWRLRPVPLYFRVVHGARFLRQLRYLRTSRVRSWLFDLAALTGGGWIGANAGRVLLSRRPQGRSPVEVNVVEHFGGWADELWRRCAARYSFVGVRTSAVLNRVYPPGRAGLVRLQVADGQKVLGYAVVQDEEGVHAEHFGEMRVGTVVDALAEPVDAPRVVWETAEALAARGVDVIISNQSHPAWVEAMQRAGFVKGPSNCVFGAANELGELLDAVDVGEQALHVNRGDGDWPWGYNARVDSVPPS